MSTEPTHDRDGPGEPDGDEQRQQSETLTLEDEQSEQVELNPAPSRLSQGISVGGGVVGALLSAPFATLALPFGLAGAAMVTASMLAVYSVKWLTVGTGMILVGALIAGAFGVLPPEIMLLAVGTAVLGWDAGQHGIGIGRQLGRQTRTERNEAVHVAGSALVIGLASAFAYFVYLVGAGGRPAPAVALLVVGILLLTWMLRS
jgi:hypothetical protein